MSLKCAVRYPVSVLLYLSLCVRACQTHPPTNQPNLQPFSQCNYKLHIKARSGGTETVKLSLGVKAAFYTEVAARRRKWK